MTSLISGYASSSDDEEPAGPSVLPGIASGKRVFCVPDKLPDDLQRPGALARVAQTLAMRDPLKLSSSVLTPWSMVGEAGKVDALVAAAQKFTRDVAEGRQAPGMV